MTIAQQAGDDGRLFGSVTTQDITDSIKDARNIEVDRRKVHLDEPIRNLGTYQGGRRGRRRRHGDGQDDRRLTPSSGPRRRSAAPRFVLSAREHLFGAGPRQTTRPQGAG